MSSVPNLRTVVEDVELHHVAFEPPFRYLKRRVDDALAGYGYRIERLIGPSRVGKSMLFKALSRLYPAQKIDGRREVPVLHVQLKNFVSPLALPTTVLKALGVSVPRGRYNGEELLTLMQDQLRLARTRVMLFEEASHVVERGSRVDPHDAADWFKGVAESLNMTLLMEGVPRLELLFERNEQLRLRASRRLELWPYDMRETSDASAFAACVKTYANLFATRGWVVEQPHRTLVRHCYLLSGGRVGVLAKFMQELAATVDGQEPRALTWQDLREVADIIEGAGHPDHRPFVRPEVTEVELAAAYGYAINDSGMPLRRRRTTTGGDA